MACRFDAIAVCAGQSDGGDHRQPECQSRGKKCARVDPPDYDAGKKIRGRKRHVLVDARGMLMHAVVYAADVQDRDGGDWVMATLFGLYPFLLKPCAGLPNDLKQTPRRTGETASASDEAPAA